MGGDDELAARVERVAEIDRRIDPAHRRRGRVVADLITVGALAPISIALDWHATRPFVMLALMAGALAVNRLVPLLTERKLRREREELLAGSGRSEI